MLYDLVATVKLFSIALVRINLGSLTAFFCFFQELKNVYGEPQGRKKAQNQMGCPEIE